MIALQAASRPAGLALCGAPGPKPQSQRLASKLAFVSRPLATNQTRPPALRSAGDRLRVSAVAEFTSTVRIVVQGRGISVTPAIKEYSENKVQKAVHNFESAVKQVDVKLSVEGKHGGRSTDAHHQRQQTAEVTVYTLRHGVVRVEDTEDDLYAAIDLVTDKVKRKLAKLKEKAVQRNLWPGRGGTKGGAHVEDGLDETEVVDTLPTDQVATLPAEVVREKILMTAPMSLEDAVEQIENVGHDFFIFQDSQDNALKVVYRRKAHGYGLIIPQPEVRA